MIAKNNDYDCNVGVCGSATEIGREPNITENFLRAIEFSENAKDKLRYICSKVGIDFDRPLQCAKVSEPTDLKSISIMLTSDIIEFNDTLERIVNELG